MPQIKVHERALAHLSRGLYRSPASALRELVSNAWDANATQVTIDTNHPNFFQLAIEDNGDGFNRDDFEALMGGGIGNSTKRAQQTELKWGRPVIGRLGIGMLGIAQICGSFIVISKPRSGIGFKARVNLYDLAKSQWDNPSSDLVEERTIQVGGQEIRELIHDVGTYDFDDDFNDTEYSFGTRILVNDVVPQFTQAFQESLRFEGFNEVPRNWQRAVTAILTNSESLQQLGDYWRLLWELSVACPLPYLTDDALPDVIVKETNAILRSYNFGVTVDGRRLFKPIFLKDNDGGYTIRAITRDTKHVYGVPLTFSGYITVQEGKQIRPGDLRGILVRIRNIGIGYYDQSMLDYPVNEGPRSRWLTGEIFVEEGLEDALNIDRDSFNRFHPEFRALQTAIHGILRTEIFPAVYRNIDVRSEKRHAEIEDRRNDVRDEVIGNAENRNVTITERKDLGLLGEPHSNARQTRRAVEIEVPEMDQLPTKKSARQLTQSLLAIFELATLAESKDEQRKRFTDLLFALLKRW